MFASAHCAAPKVANVAFAIMPTQWWGHVHKCSSALVVLDMKCNLFMVYRATCLSARICNLEAAQVSQVIIHVAFHVLITATETGLHTAKLFSMISDSSHKDTQTPWTLFEP